MQAPAARPHAVLLDYGGTLDGDALHWLDHFAALYARFGASVTGPALKAAFHAADDAIARLPDVRRFGLVAMAQAHVRLQLGALALDDAELERRLIEAFVADTRSAWERNRPVLQRMAAAFRLGVVSNGYGNLPTLLDEAALAPFAIVIDSALVGLRKPDPAIYELAARRLDMPCAVILHVGDSWERDVVPARSLGMRAAWLAPADATMPSGADDVWHIASLRALEELLS